MILIDTSAWIAFFRGIGPVADRVDEALEEDLAALCGPVVTELRRGFKSTRDRAKTLPLLDACHWLSQPDSLWEEAGDLGFALRGMGLTIKTMDLLIATYALSHGAWLLTANSDFASMRDHGVPLMLA